MGNLAQLTRIQELAPLLRPRFRIVIAQPGLSIASCKEEHLRLIAGADSYVKAVTKGVLEVFCSP